MTAAALFYDDSLRCSESDPLEILQHCGALEAAELLLERLALDSLPLLLAEARDGLVRDRWAPFAHPREILEPFESCVLVGSLCREQCLIECCDSFG
jgi:hypothetical protein